MQRPISPVALYCENCRFSVVCLGREMLSRLSVLEPGLVYIMRFVLGFSKQRIWDEVGESDAEKEAMLLQLEQECLQVYGRKVEHARNVRTRLHKALADSEAELAALISRLGDRPLLGRSSERRAGTLKEHLASIQPQLDELRRKQDMRLQQFMDVKAQIQMITSEILSPTQQNAALPLDEKDLSLKKLDEFHIQFQALKKEKNERLQKVSDYVNTIQELCAVLGMEFSEILTEVHPSLNESSSGQCRSITDTTLNRLAETVDSFIEEKRKRIVKLQHLASCLIELWNLMDTPVEEQQSFGHITCILSMTEDEVSTPQALTLDTIKQAEVEVERLDKLKSSKTKELVMKKQEELDEICKQAHMDSDASANHERFMAIIDSGNFDPSELLTSMDHQIDKAKDDALKRKDILEKVEKWMAACEEESWLEDYNSDQNRYNSTRGAHLNLKRAERARITVNKLLGLVDALMVKTCSWEEDHGVTFVYDGRPLLDMLQEYKLLRQDKEAEKRRLREHKKQTEQMNTEQEALFGTRWSPSKGGNAKKQTSGGGRTPEVQSNRRHSWGAKMGSSSNGEEASGHHQQQHGDNGRGDGASSAAGGAE